MKENVQYDVFISPVKWGPSENLKIIKDDTNGGCGT